MPAQEARPRGPPFDADNLILRPFAMSLSPTLKGFELYFENANYTAQNVGSDRIISLRTQLVGSWYRENHLDIS